MAIQFINTYMVGAGGTLVDSTVILFVYDGEGFNIAMDPACCCTTLPCDVCDEESAKSYLILVLSPPTDLTDFAPNVYCQCLAALEMKIILNLYQDERYGLGCHYSREFTTPNCMDVFYFSAEFHMLGYPPWSTLLEIPQSDLYYPTCWYNYEEVDPDCGQQIEFMTDLEYCPILTPCSHDPGDFRGKYPSMIVQPSDGPAGGATALCVFERINYLLLCNCTECWDDCDMPAEILAVELIHLEELGCEPTLLVCEKAPCLGIEHVYDLPNNEEFWWSGVYEPSTGLTCTGGKADSIDVQVIVFRELGQQDFEVGATLSFWMGGNHHLIRTAAASRVAWPMSCATDTGAKIPLDEVVEGGPFTLDDLAVVVFCDPLQCPECKEDTTRDYIHLAIWLPEHRSGAPPTYFCQNFKGSTPRQLLVVTLPRDLEEGLCTYQTTVVSEVCLEEYLFKVEFLDDEGTPTIRLTITGDGINANCDIDLDPDEEMDCGIWRSFAEAKPTAFTEACIQLCDLEVVDIEIYPSDEALSEQIEYHIGKNTPASYYDWFRTVQLCEADQCIEPDGGIRGEVLAVEILGMETLGCAALIVRERASCAGVETDVVGTDDVWWSGVYDQGDPAGCDECIAEALSARILIFRPTGGGAFTVGAKITLECEGEATQVFSTKPESRLAWPLDCSDDVSIPVDEDADHNPVDFSVVIPACEDEEE